MIVLALRRTQALTHPQPSVYTLEQWLQNPDWLKPPQAIAQRFLYRDNLTMLAGREKDGKSTLAGYIAACVSSGKDLLGEPTVRGPVLWLRLEEPPRTLFKRLVDFGADPSNIIIPDKLPRGPDDLPGLMEQYQPLAVVVDTLTALARDRIRDPYSSIEWTRLMLPIAELAQQHHAGILLNHHARKSDGKYRDSTAIGASVDHILEMNTDSADDRVRVFEPRGRWETAPFRIRFADNRYFLANVTAELDDKVLAFIHANPDCGLRQLRTGVGGKGEKVDKALARLVARGSVQNTSADSTKHAYRAVA